jgi:hypothetical protein
LVEVFNKQKSKTALRLALLNAGSTNPLHYGTFQKAMHVVFFFMR